MMRMAVVMVMGIDRQKLELYVHIPFCVKKCEYCDFLSAPCSGERQEAYFLALKEEIRKAAALVRGKCVSTLFFGGGTPSLAEGERIAELLRLIKSAFFFQEGAEVTLEANPGTLTEEKLSIYREAGINRLSIGCQSVHDSELRRLGRIHNFFQFQESYELARKAGFSNINVDLMSGLPEQSLERWEESLRTVAEMGPEHISAYSLIVEEGTPFYEEQELKLPDEDTERQMYWRTGEILGDYGFEQYEISNYAKPGFACRHNMGYWKRTNYLGFGIGAASLLDEERFSNERNMEKYLENSGSLEQIRQNRETLDEKDRIEETMILGLRMRQGVSIREFRENFGKSPDELYGQVMEKYISGGFLEEKDGYLRLTFRGIDVSNVILADFLLEEL